MHGMRALAPCLTLHVYVRGAIVEMSFDINHQEDCLLLGLLHVLAQPLLAVVSNGLPHSVGNEGSAAVTVDPQSALNTLYKLQPSVTFTFDLSCGIHHSLQASRSTGLTQRPLEFSSPSGLWYSRSLRSSAVLVISSLCVSWSVHCARTSELTRSLWGFSRICFVPKVQHTRRVLSSMSAGFPLLQVCVFRWRSWLSLGSVVLVAPLDAATSLVPHIASSFVHLILVFQLVPSVQLSALHVVKSSSARRLIRVWELGTSYHQFSWNAVSTSIADRSPLGGSLRPTRTTNTAFQTRWLLSHTWNCSTVNDLTKLVIPSTRVSSWYMTSPDPRIPVLRSKICAAKSSRGSV